MNMQLNNQDAKYRSFYRSCKIRSFKFFLIACIAAGFISQAEAAVYYVKANAPGGNGTSWAKAFNNLDSALTAAAVGGPNQIWIAKGTYKPTLPHVQLGYLGNPTQSNLRTFLLPSRVAIYGGFNGTETLVSQRSANSNPTILSGDLNGDDINDVNHTQFNKADNSWHVLTAEGVTAVTLDSLTVRDGYGAGPDHGAPLSPPNFILSTIDYTYDAGGGMLVRGSQINLNNMVFEFNAVDVVNSTILGPQALGFPPEATVGGL